MKCPNCGFELKNPEVNFCPSCGAPLFNVTEEADEELNREPVWKDAPIPEPVVPQEPEIEEEPEKPAKPVRKKPGIDPEAARKTGKMFWDSFRYMLGTLIHPGRDSAGVPMVVSMVTALLFMILNCVSMFFYSSGIVKWVRDGLKGAPGKLFRLTAANPNVSFSIFRVIIGGIALTLGLLAVMTLLCMILRVMKKARIGAAASFKQATQQLVLPEWLLLVAGIVFYIVPAYGIYAVYAVTLLLFMHIAFMFKEKQGWLSYLVILLGYSLFIVLCNEVIYMVVAK